MKKYIVIGTLFILVLFTSCTPEPLDIDIPQVEQKPVLTSQYFFDSSSNQSVFLVILTRTLSVTNDAIPKLDSNGLNINSTYFISGARIQLSTTAGETELVEVVDGTYIAENIVFIPGEICSIDAKDERGKKIISAQTIAMPQKDFTSLSVLKVQNQLQLNYQINDNINKPNWYLVNYFVKQQNDTVTKYADPNYIARKLTEQRLDFDLYTDADFTNGLFNFSKKIPLTGFDSMAVAITEITQGYYQFLTAQKRYGKLINQLRGEAMSFPTNVNGGLGYFTLNQPKLYFLPIK